LPMQADGVFSDFPSVPFLIFGDRRFFRSFVLLHICGWLFFSSCSPCPLMRPTNSLIRRSLVNCVFPSYPVDQPHFVPPFRTQWLLPLPGICGMEHVVHFSPGSGTLSTPVYSSWEPSPDQAQCEFLLKSRLPCFPPSD